MGVRVEFEKHSNFIAAVLTVVAPILGVWVAVAVGAQGDAESRVDALERRAAADRSANNSLRGTNDQLQREIEERDRRIAALEGQLKEALSGEGGTPGPGSGEGVSVPAVRNSGEIKIGDEILDLDAKDPK